MRIVDLNQRSPEWYAWRKGGIGGSDAPAIVGDGFIDPQELAAVKLGLMTVEVTERMERGTRLEPRARMLYEALTGIPMAPVCVMNDEYEWVRASLDGWNPDRRIILEVKCPESTAAHQKALEGIIPPYYKAQLQHQFLAADEAERLHFWSFTDSPTFSLHERFALVEVVPDLDYQRWLLRQEKKFLRTIGRLVE